MTQILFLIIALVICITVHEAAHAWTAYKLGDPTAKVAGRVSLNPMRHLDILGTLMIFIAHFGWGKPVPYNYYNLSHPRRDSALIALAGPMANLITAFALSILLKHVPMPEILASLIQAIYSLSIVLLLFNLLPIAPLDGSKLIGLIIPHSQEDLYQRIMSQGPLILIVLIIGDRLLASVSGFSFLGTYLQYGYELITVTFLLVI